MGLIILPDAEYAKIRELFSGKGVIVMPKSLSDKYSNYNLRDKAAAYDFGGEADVWVDFVDTDEHFFVSSLKEGEEE